MRILWKKILRSLISYRFVTLYRFLFIYIIHVMEKNKELPKRVANVIDKNFVGRVMATLKQTEKINLKANEKHTYGFVIYPK